MLKKMAMVFGIIFLVIGVLGFIPGVTTSDHLLLGIFKVNAAHNVVHILSGLVALWVSMASDGASKVYFQVFGVVYLLVAVLGFTYGDNDIVGLVSSNMADTWLHVVIAAAALYLGFAVSEG